MFAIAVDFPFIKKLTEVVVVHIFSKFPSHVVFNCSEQYDTAYERISMLFNAALWYMKHSLKFAGLEEYAFLACHCFPFFHLSLCVCLTVLMCYLFFIVIS